MPFDFKPCLISGLYEIQPKVFQDNRGYFFESYSKRDFDSADISVNFVQDNQSFSKKGTLRGLHFQKKHPQGKLVSAIDGEIFDVVVDIRKDSPSFGQWHSIILSDQKKNMLYIPPGFAHGYLVLSNTAVFSYKCTDFYYPEDESGIIFNDPKIGINWPDLGIEFILSEKDKKWPCFKDIKL